MHALPAARIFFWSYFLPSGNVTILEVTNFTKQSFLLPYCTVCRFMIYIESLLSKTLYNRRDMDSAV